MFEEMSEPGAIRPFIFAPNSIQHIRVYDWRLMILMQNNMQTVG
jgi:hypothetical protein